MGETIRIAVGVWGDWHTRAMVKLNFATLLSPGNVPAIADRCRLIFDIHTREFDKAYILASPEYEALKQYCDFEFKVIDELILEDPIAAHKLPWNEATEKARENGEFVCFYHPDIAWSDGSFTHLANLIASGKKAIFKGFMRVVDTTFENALVENFRDEDGAITIAPRALVKLGLEHLHPMMASYDRRSLFFPSHTEMIVWPVPGEGIHCRILAREMFIFDPNTVAHNPNLLLESAPSADAVEMVGNSDDLFAVSLAPLGKDIRWYDTPRRMDVQNFAPWLELYDSDWNEHISMTPINWGMVSSDTARWRRRERASELTIKRIRECYRATWVWRMTSHMNMSSAACEILAYLMSSRLLYRIPAEPRATAVIIPQNNALEPFGENMYDLLAPENRDRFIELVKDYIVTDPRCAKPIHEWLDTGEKTDLETLSGRKITVDRPTEADLYIAGDGVLYPFTSVKALDLNLYTTSKTLPSELLPAETGANHIGIDNAE